MTFQNYFLVVNKNLEYFSTPKLGAFSRILKEVAY